MGDRKIDLGWGLASMTVREYEVRGYIHLYREKWLNPEPYCLRESGKCLAVRIGLRKCIDAPCSDQHIQIARTDEA